MKKVFLASLLALFAVSATASELTLRTSVNQAKVSNPNCGFIIGPMTCTPGQNRTEYEIMWTDRKGPLAVSVGLATSNGGSSITMPTDGPFKNERQYRYSLTGSYDVAKVKSMTVSADLGLMYLQNQYNKNGYALAPGLTLAHPITNNTSLVASVARQVGASDVSRFDGNRLSIGLRHSF